MQAELTRRGARGHDEGTALIDRVYRRCYGATIPAHADELVIVRGAHGRVVAAASLRDATTGLFSQAYLDQPAHRAASQAVGFDIDDSQIIEVGTLASDSALAVLPLIAKVIETGQARGMRASLFTATAHLRRLLSRTPLAVFDLGPARAERVADPAAWGRYYSTDPHVCVVPDPCLIPACRAGQEAA